MRALLLFPALLFFGVASPSAAQEVHADGTAEAGLRPRLAAPDAEFSITTKQRDFELHLRGDSLLVQLSDRGLEDLRNGVGKDDADEDRSLFASMIEGALRGGLVSLMDRAVAMHVSEVDQGLWERNGLRLMNDDGEEIFNITLNDRDVMEDFTERDARRFLERLGSAKRDSGR